jgi:hypothetical protein
MFFVFGASVRGDGFAVKDRACGKSTGGYRRAERDMMKGSMWQSSGIRDDDRLFSIALRGIAVPRRADRATSPAPMTPRLC